MTNTAQQTRVEIINDRCADCGADGYVAATPEGEIRTDWWGLAFPNGVEGLVILCGSEHGGGDAVCDSCERGREAEIVARRRQEDADDSDLVDPDCKEEAS